MQITETSHESHRRVKNVALLITRTMAKAGGWTQLHGLTLAIHIDIGLVSGPPNISCLTNQYFLIVSYELARIT